MNCIFSRNPYYNAGNQNSNKNDSWNSKPKTFGETPASPDTPSSPLPYEDNYHSRPIVIPTERNLKFTNYNSSSSKSKYDYSRPRTPSPPSSKFLPIKKINLKEVKPNEWDSDEEGWESDNASKEIINPETSTIGFGPRPQPVEPVIGKFMFYLFYRESISIGIFTDLSLVF